MSRARALVISCVLFMALIAAIWASAQELPTTDLRALVDAQCGPTGFNRNAGCRVRMPRGVTRIAPTEIGLSDGVCTLRTLRNGLILEGESSSLFAEVPFFPSAGSTLQYAGPPGGVMLSVCGSRIKVRDLAIDARGAGVALRWWANNAVGAISHFGGAQDLDVFGADVGLEVAGANSNDQSDFLSFASLSIRGARVGVRVDSQQAVANLFKTIEVSASEAGFDVRGGSFLCEGCYAANSTSNPDFVGVRLRRSAVVDGRNFAAHQATIRDSHFELTAGRFIVAEPGVQFPINLSSNSYQVQCPTPDCEMRVLDSWSAGPVTIVGDFVAGNGLGRARVCHRGPALRAINFWRMGSVRELLMTC